MRLKRRHFWWSAGALVTALALGIATYGSPADERARSYFSIAPEIAINEETLREAALQKVPLGSSAAQVQAALERTPAGKDDLCRYYPPGKDREGVLRIEYDVNTLELVKVSYGIKFRFNTRGLLSDVYVSRWLTGL